MPRKVIIGLHGLSNKPPEDRLKEWWWKSITDGVHFHREREGAPTANERQTILPEANFTIIYWASLMYPHAKDIYSSNDNYVKIDEKPPGRKPKWSDGVRRWFRETSVGVWDGFRRRLPGNSYQRLVNRFLKEKFQDLHAYWAKKITRKFKYWEDDEWHEERREITDDQLRDDFKDALLKNINSEEEVDVLVIAHSMGTIIAYDTITGGQLSALDQNPVALITIGSPLGLPTVRDHLNKPPGEKRPTFLATRLKAWFNFADPGDLIAAVPHLAPHFKDPQGTKRIKDSLVQNDFRDRDGNINSHKSFGYLRCPEVAAVVDRFLKGL